MNLTKKLLECWKKENLWLSSGDLCERLGIAKTDSRRIKVSVRLVVLYELEILEKDERWRTVKGKYKGKERTYPRLVYCYRKKS